MAATHVGAAILMTLAISLTSCLVIPTPWTKGRYELREIELVPGESTRDDVVRELGEPDVIWETERVFVYEWQRLRGVMLWGIASGRSSGM